MLALPAVAAGQAPPTDGAEDPPVLGPEVPRGSIDRVAAPLAAPSAKTVDGEVGDWNGRATRFGGTLLYSRGELVYQDHIWDAHGADDGGDAERLALLDPLADLVPHTYRLDPAYQADIPGQFGIPAPECDGCSAEPRYGDLEGADASDLSEVRLGAGGNDVFLLARTTTLTASDQTALLVLADTAPGEHEYDVPWSSEVKTRRADTALLFVGDQGWSADLASGEITPLPAGSVATNPAGWTNAIEARVPRALVGDGDRLKVAIASGPWDPAGGHFEDSGLPANVANVAFRTDEPVREWFEKRQALSLEKRTMDPFFVDAAADALERGENEDFKPTPGYHDRLFLSSEAISREGGSNGTLQRYGVYLPTGYDGQTRRALQLWLHWRGGTAHQGAALAPRIFDHLGEDRGAIVVSPHGRGTSRWYVGIGHADFREVWSDVHDSFAIDPDRRYTAGHSMGGWGSYLLSILYPDRFAAAFPVAGPVTQGAWTGADFEGCDEFEFDGATPCYIEANGSDPRAQHTRKLLDNLRHVPIAIFQAAEDELVPTSGVTRQVERLAQLGYRHRYYLFPAHEHYSHPLVDQWSEGGRYEHQFTRDPNPSRVTYKRDMPFERATETVQSEGYSFDFEFDSAYWMSDLEPVDAQDGVAYFDGSTRAKPEQPYVTAPEAGGPAAPGQTGPYAMEGIAWLANPVASAPAASNAFEAELTGARGVKLDLQRMEIDNGRRIDGEVSNDAPLALRLDGGWPSEPTVTVNDAPVPVTFVTGELTVTLPAGTNRIVIEPQPAAQANSTPPTEGSAGADTQSQAGAPTDERCVDRRRFSFRLNQPRGARIVGVDVYVDGKRELRRRVRGPRKRITSVSITRPPSGNFRVKIVSFASNGNRIISTRTYTDCEKSRPKTRVVRGKNKRRRAR